MKKVVEAVGDADDEIYDIGSKVSNSKSTQSAVNKAMRTAKYIGSYSSDASAIAFGFVNNLLDNTITETAVNQVALTAAMYPVTHKIIGPTTLFTTGAEVVKLGYLKKKLSDDNKKYKRKAAEAREMRDEMRNDKSKQKNLHMYK